MSSKVEDIVASSGGKVDMITAAFTLGYIAGEKYSNSLKDVSKGNTKKYKAVLQTPEKLEGLKLLQRGKVRDIFSIDGVSDALLFVASDRLSCFDVVLKSGITNKGKILTQISQFWFDVVKDVVPNHVITSDVSKMPPAVRKHADILKGRTMLVKKLKMLPVECIVRGYLSGSGWKDYKRTGSVCGIDLPKGLQNSSKLPKVIFTPSSKAEYGIHDENITYDKAVKMIGEKRAKEVADLSKAVYARARDLAATKGIILADTKFEFGLDANGKVVLGDEVLTPDSSRYWPKSKYKVGQQQQSFDKQFVRDWLESIKFDKKTPIEIPDDVAEKTMEKYIEIFKILTGDLPKDM